jgi:hypothetical protein
MANALTKEQWLTHLREIWEKAIEQPTVAELNNEYLKDTNVMGLEQPAWQGLTDDEINNIYDNCQKVIAETNIKRVGDNALDVFLIGISNAIKTGILESEQALKEKNNG